MRAAPRDPAAAAAAKESRRSAASPAMPGPVELPSVEELDVPELAVGSAVLKAGAHHYGSQCDRINKEFMLCRWEERDPRKCLNEGRAVSKCAVDFFRQIKLHCAEPFNQYWNCLDESNMSQFRYCRKEQQLFDDCVLDKLGWVRPELGQLSKVTKVNTVRPIPENPCHSQVRPAANPPTEGEYKPAKYGNRGYFWSW